MICKKCGTAMKDTAKFCVKCGTRFDTEARPQAPAPAPMYAPPAAARTPQPTYYSPPPAAKTFQPTIQASPASSRKKRGLVGKIIVLALFVILEAAVFFVIPIPEFVYKLAAAVCLLIAAAAAFMIIVLKTKETGSVADRPVAVPAAPPADTMTMFLNEDDKTVLLTANGPAVMERPYNIHITLNGSTATYRRDRFPCVIGRQDNMADIVVSDSSVSRRHALLERGGGLQITSLSETNGVLVNGTRISEPTAITDNDIITIGRATLRIEVL